MKKFKIAHGLGGGFGGAQEEDEIYEFNNEDEAWDFAWEKACEDYGSYVGMYGLRDVDQIMEEDGVDEDTAWEIYSEERESWLVYDVEEVEDDD